LSQLLGLRTNDTNVQRLIQDIGKFQRGEKIEQVAADTTETAAPQIADLHKTDSLKLVHDHVPRTASSKKQNIATKKQPSNLQQPNLARKKSPTPPPPSKANAPPSITKPAPTPSKVNDSSPMPPSKPPNEPSKKGATRLTPPPRGKAPLDCGCFGTYHQPLANCLFCGRIACTAEGYNFCPFCGYLVEQVKVSEELRNDPAWRHKERLLQFDREFASRTIVLDDMANYESDQVAAWLTPEQQAEAAQKEQERQDQLHKRKNMQLNIAM